MENWLQAQVNRGDMLTRGPELKVFGWRGRSFEGRFHISDFFRQVLKKFNVLEKNKQKTKTKLSSKIQLREDREELQGDRRC